MSNPTLNLGRTSRRPSMWILTVLALLTVLPATAQEVDGIEWDPGFDHNHLGRTIGGVNSGVRDSGTYCGPLPRHVCGGVTLSELLFSGQDPFHPQSWVSHLGNDWARQHAARKGHLLQTLMVRNADGSPAARVPVRFYKAGYNKKGVVGRTDDDGLFVVSLKETDKNHRFLVEADGHRRARLDVLGHDLRTATHQIVLEPVGRRTDAVWESSNSAPRIAVFGDDAVPARLARDYKRALKALERGQFDVAVVELQALVERWPVGTLEDGDSYEPRRLLVEALEASGQASLAETIKQRPLVVMTDTQITG